MNTNKNTVTSVAIPMDYGKTILRATLMGAVVIALFFAFGISVALAQSVGIAQCD